MRDRRVREHPLDVVLGQRDEVAEGHREGREDDDHDVPVGGERPERLAEEPDDQREGADLRADREVAGDRRRGALVRVRRPVVERHRGDLERDARGQEREPHAQARASAAPAGRRSAVRDCGHAVDPGRAGEAPDEREAEQEDRAARTSRAGST